MPTMKTRSKVFVMGATATGVLAIGLGAGAQRLLVKQDTYLATAGGSVGVGTATPSSKLTVAGGPIYQPDTRATQLVLNAPGAYYAGIQNTDAQKWSLSYGNIPGSLALGTPVLTWGSDGNVGIGTPTPASRLTVSSGPIFQSDYNATQLVLNAVGTYYAGIQNTAAQKWSLSYGNIPGSLALGTPVLTWGADGNVGINTTTPSYKLSVSGPGAFDTLESINGSGDPLEINYYTAAPTKICATAGCSVATYFAPTTGNVGIGTNAPTYKLHVVGTAAGTSWTNLSSREYKDDVRYVASSEYDQMLAKVVAMKPARYRYKAAYTDDQSVHLGFIAEEMPRDVLSPNGKGVDTYELVTYLAGAVKAQQAQLKTQEALLKAQREQLTAQREQLTAQRDKMARLEELVRKIAAR
jgi:hypothetical protein